MSFASGKVSGMQAWQGNRKDTYYMLKLFLLRPVSSVKESVIELLFIVLHIEGNAYEIEESP